MKKYLQANIDYLCRQIEGIERGNGALNVSKAARTIGLTQTTLMRILDGSADYLKPKTEAAIRAYFKLEGEDLMHSDLSAARTMSKIDRIDALISELTEDEKLELYRRQPNAKIVFE
jgi:hypothetical protein